MTIYVATFVISSLLVEAGARGLSTRPWRALLLAVPVLLMAVVAGARDYIVGGPDVLVYGNNLFLGATNAKNFESLDTFARSLSINGEPGYVAINFIASRVTDDPHVFYFLLSAFVSTIVVVAIVLMRGFGSPGLMWLTYLCTAYVDTFNLLRQAPSLALALLGIVLVLRQRKWLGLAVGAAGLLFHASAIAFLAMWVVAVHLRASTEGRTTRRVFLVIGVTVAGVFASSYLLELGGVVLGDSKYASYLQDSARTGASVGLDVLYRLVPILAGMYVLAKLRRESVGNPVELRDTHGIGQTQTLTRTRPEMIGTATDLVTKRNVLTVLLVLLVIELLLIPLREISYPLYRVPLYFGYVRVIAYAAIVSGLRVHRIPGALALIGFVGAYFVLVVLMRNDGYYTSDVLTEWFRP